MKKRSCSILMIQKCPNILIVRIDRRFWYNEFTHIATVHGDEAVFSVFLIGFITVLFSGPIEHWEAALIILRESVDAMTSLLICCSLTPPHCLWSASLLIIIRTNIDWEIPELKIEHFEFQLKSLGFQSHYNILQILTDYSMMWSILCLHEFPGRDL